MRGTHLYLSLIYLNSMTFISGIPPMMAKYSKTLSSLLMKVVRVIKTIDEVFMLAIVPVHKTEKELNISREQVYAKYTDIPVAENS